MNILNPVTMPLRGLNLIEASAGTGKTFTITTLYLRLLLGLVIEDECNDGLSIDQILVVTFTEAATEEIRDRVRKKLVEAKNAIYFNDLPPDSDNPVDPIISQLLKQLPDLTVAYQRLDAAVKNMDEAAIFTIHGFCQRMLKHHAFESGSLFDNEFILDEREYLANAVRDFWRCTVYPLSGVMLDLFLSCWQTPDGLLSDIYPLLNKQAEVLQPIIDGDQLEQDVETYASLSKQIKSLWLQDSIPALINELPMLKNRKPGKPEFLEAFSDFCLSDELTFKKNKDSWEVWSPESMLKAMKKGSASPEHPIFSLFEQASALSEKIKSQLKAYYRQLAYQQLQYYLAEQKRLQQKISPDDLLTNMQKALFDDDGGERLAEKIAQQFPVAMIDEFQDTDPLQYGIFSKIYQTIDNSKTMIMIGDPKQAIYGFRGADIFTYIAAKEAVLDEQQYTLNTNWRSSKALIAGVNGLFSYSQDAFVYNQAIPFIAVDAADKVAKKPLSLPEQQTAALQLWPLLTEDDAPITKSVAMEHLALRTSNEIVSILTQAQQQQGYIGERAIVAGDICILVRDRNEAAVMRDTLAKAGVSSVYLSRQSVFDTPLAMDFYLLLQAIYQQTGHHGGSQSNERAIRAALITPFFGYSIDGLWQLTQDEQQWQLMLEQFIELNRLWMRFGVMAVLQHLLQHHDLASRWRQTKQLQNPERMLTDIRHIAELLQQKSMELDGTHRLLAWFFDQLNQAKDEDKIQQLRLENDSNLVQIVTMHASKGLEYNIVFLPFVCGFRAAKSAVYHNDDDQLVIDFADNDSNVAMADKERLAEDLRLLYVALTRGVYRCYVGLFNLKVGNAKASLLTQTALGYLLFNGLEINNHNMMQALFELRDKLNSENANTCAIEAIDINDELASFTPIQQQQPQYLQREFNGKIEQDWKVTSYSALSYGVASVHVLPGHSDEGSEQAIVATSNQETSNVLLDQFSFPKGADPGSCLHQILENIDFNNFAPEQNEAVEKALADYGIDNQWQLAVEQWMSDVLQTPWNGKGLQLNKLRPQDCLIEMEFYLPMDKIRAKSINQVLSTHLKRKIDVFDFIDVKGILKGYIDLTINWQGRFYVVDYKSNHLGDSFEDYHQDQLEQAMDAHHYHLQYLLYSLALHRMLQQKLVDYDFDQHFGGCYYLFLRGMSSNNLDHHGIYFAKPKRALIEQLDGLFKGELPQKQSPDDKDSPQQLGLFGA